MESSLHGRLFVIPGSCSDAVVALARVLGLELKLLLRANHNDELIAVNSLRTVPTYVNSNGEVLTETSAILNYLARINAPALVPNDPFMLSRLEEIMSFISTSVYAAFLLQFRPDRSSREESAHHAIRGKATESIDTALDELQRRVGGNQFVLGNDLSTADFLALVMLRWAMRVNPALLQLRPALNGLLQRIEAHVAQSRAIASAT
jgi:glutathione S-transferase